MLHFPRRVISILSHSFRTQYSEGFIYLYKLPIMFLTLPKSAPCSRATTPTTEDTDSRPKSRRHSSLFSLVKSKKDNRKSKPYTYPINTSSPLLPPDNPPEYSTIYPKTTRASEFHNSSSEPPPISPSLHSSTRSRNRKPAHLRRPSKPWTSPPNAPKRTQTLEEAQDEFYPYSSFHPGPQANRNSHVPKVVISGSPPREGGLCSYSTFYPSSQTDDMSLFSPFGSAPSGGFYERKEGERKGRRISTGNAWEKIGERRARESARRWG